jgi:integrase
LLLTIGFGAALRRSELVDIRIEHIEVTTEGLKVTIQRSKTDQQGAGQVVPVLDGPRLQVKATLAAWLSAAQIDAGYLFRSIVKGDSVQARPVSDRTVANIIKSRATAAGLDASDFSGHSLRSGFLTSAANSGASVFAMMGVSRHRNIETLRGYVRQAEIFKNHAGSAFM